MHEYFLKIHFFQSNFCGSQGAGSGSAALHRCQPQPWHAVHSIEQRLLAQGFKELQEAERWKLEAGGVIM